MTSLRVIQNMAIFADKLLVPKTIWTEGAATGKSYDDVIGFTGSDSTLNWNGTRISRKDRKMRQGCRDIDVRQLQKTLRQNNVKLDW